MRDSHFDSMCAAFKTAACVMAAAPLVFIGYGIYNSTFGDNAYKIREQRKKIVNDSINVSIGHCEPDGAIRDSVTIERYNSLKNILYTTNMGALNALRQKNVAICLGGPEQPPVVATFSKAAAGYKISIPESASGVRWAATLIQQAANRDLSKYSTGTANYTAHWYDHAGRSEKIERVDWAFE
jgi:hypothetical protein